MKIGINEKLLRITVALLLALAALLLPAFSRADGEVEAGELLSNGDFSEFDEFDRLPAGWELEAYNDSAEHVNAFLTSETDYGYCIQLDCVDENDARVVQTIDVEPGAVYCISGTISTDGVYGGRGATLSVDNYSIDGTYCYSKDVTDTSDWEHVVMYVRAGEEQDLFRVAMRLGGYGTTAVGTAWFSGISVTKADDVAGLRVIDLATENGEPGTAVSSVSAFLASENAVFTWMLIITAAFAAAYGLLYVKWLRYETPLRLFDAPAPYNLGLLMLAAVLLRAVLSVLFVGHSTDIGCFMAWGSAVRNGLSSFYTSGMFADYPPGYMYVLGAISWLGDTLGLSAGSSGYVFLFKLPATLADLASAWLIWRYARRNGISEGFSLALASLLLFCPAIAYVTGAWGQIDSLLTLLIAGAFLLFQDEQRILSGALYGLAILFKPQALMFGPLFAVAYLIDLPGKGWGKRLIETVLAVVAALAVLFALSLPFKGGQAWTWIVDKYLATAGSYPYASIEAFNMPALLGDNWAPVFTKVLGLSYRVWGTAAITLSVFSAAFLYQKGRERDRGALFLCGAFMLAMIFTFGHYMHERYLLPVLLLLLFAYIYCRDRRLLVSFGWFSASVMLNALAAMYIVDHQSARGAYYNAVTFAGSLIEVLGFVFLAYTAFDILFRSHVCRPLAAQKTSGREQTSVYVYTPLPAVSEAGSVPRRTRRDTVLMCVLTFVYGVVALLNLGSLRAPQTYWAPESVGESALIRFERRTQVSEYWVFGNIANDGTLLIQADDGFEDTFVQKYDDMFRWKPADASFEADSVRISLHAGNISINEIAFFDADGALIPARVEDSAGSQQALTDEQDTVPDVPLYYNGMYFDELYHARTAYEHLHGMSPYENSHPPLGKLLISLGIAVFGMTPFGWRIVGALFGVAMLPLMYAFARRLLKKTEYAFLASALFALDFMHFTQTRIATIDVYAVFFIILMYFFMYRYITMNFFTDRFGKTLVPLGLAGLFFGVGAACKWTCFYAGGGLAVLFFGSLIARYREYRDAQQHGTDRDKARVAPFWRNTVKTLLWCCVFYLAVPFAIYYLSYMPYYLYEARTVAGYGLTDTFSTFTEYQGFMYRYHSGLTATHPYQSAWYAWPFTLKPMWYFCNVFDGKLSTLTASGNPMVWWVCTLAAAVLCCLRIGRRIKPNRALQIICVGILANYTPWLLVTRCTFIYHFFTTTPFIILAGVYLIKEWEAYDGSVRFVKWIWLGLALVLFVLLYPGLSGLPIPQGWASILRHLPGGGLMYGA